MEAALKAGQDAAGAQPGRRLRILHVGNIANNAYNNAKLLRGAGHECHVASYDFYHFASTPEWQELTEEIDRAALGDENFPNFWVMGDKRPQTPRWFAQGPQYKVILYLHYLARGETRLAEIAWACLRYSRFKAVVFRNTLAEQQEFSESAFQAAIADLPLTDQDRRELYTGRSFERLVQSVRDGLRRFSPMAEAFSPPFAPPWLDDLARWNTALRPLLEHLRPAGVLAAAGVEVDGTIAAIGQIPDHVDPADAVPYTPLVPYWRSLFRLYDVVMLYGPDPILGALVNDRPYIAYEHGTLRELPFEDTTRGRLINKGYCGASRIFVTNTDYATQKRRLAVPDERLVFLPHAFDERPLRAFAADWSVKKPPEVTFFAPARQDWVSQYLTLTKNNHWVVHAARRLKDGGVGGFRVVFVEWGVDVAATKRLIEELDVGELFTWCKPMNKRRLWGWYLDAHAVIDQFLLPSISGVSFEALALGCRVLTRDDGISNRTAFGEQPPLLSAWDVDSVFERMREVIADPQDLKGIGRAAWEWTDRRHSASRITAIQEDVFREFVREHPRRWL